ncbi:hypothetical protein AN948_02940, partial [Rhodococcus sp. ADH]
MARSMTVSMAPSPVAEFWPLSPSPSPGSVVVAGGAVGGSVVADGGAFVGEAVGGSVVADGGAFVG